jgi:hypothetical protein
MAKQDYTFRYRVRDWPAYSRTLIERNRGRPMLKFDEHAASAWRNTSLTSGPGAPKTYSASHERLQSPKPCGERGLTV